MNVRTLVSLFMLLSIQIVYAGEADVIKVEVKKTGTDVFHFDVTVDRKSVV